MAVNVQEESGVKGPGRGSLSCVKRLEILYIEKYREQEKWYLIVYCTVLVQNVAAAATALSIFFTYLI